MTVSQPLSNRIYFTSVSFSTTAAFYKQFRDKAYYNKTVSYYNRLNKSYQIIFWIKTIIGLTSGLYSNLQRTLELEIYIIYINIYTCLCYFIANTIAGHHDLSLQVQYYKKIMYLFICCRTPRAYLCF